MALNRTPLLAALLSLAGALGATLSLYQGASAALSRVQDERLRGAGATAALLLADVGPTGERLRALMQANELDGAYVLDADLRVVADAAGPAGRRVDLLRIDPAQVARALEGHESVATTYALGALQVAGGCFPVRAAAGPQVLVLEAGETFGLAQVSLRRALAVGVGVALVGALALALMARRQGRLERARSLDEARVARAEVVARMAAMAAHEIRNPLSVVRGTVELMRERLGATLAARDSEALTDVLGEVERLRLLTEDFLDLSADRPLAAAPVLLAQVLAEAGSQTEALHPQVQVRIEAEGLPAVPGDAGRLRQVFSNLLENAAQAQGSGEIHVVARPAQDGLRVEVRDQGPGIAREVRATLFEPFVTARPGGTGLGLLLARRLVERHGGWLTLKDPGPPGATFELFLPYRRPA